MVFGAEPVGAGPLALTIHIWPTPELTAQARHWPASWHDAFERAAGLLGLGAAMRVLDGRPFSDRQFELPLFAGRVEFSVTHRGRCIHITISDFTGPDSSGPDSPGPKGGGQPRSIDGLVLGLRGAGRYYRLVVFLGFMPAIPKINELRVLDNKQVILVLKELRASTHRNDFISKHGIELLGLYASEHEAQSLKKLTTSQTDTRRNALVHGRFQGIAVTHTPAQALVATDWENQFTEMNVDERIPIEMRHLFDRLSQREHWGCNSRRLAGYCLQVRQSQSDYSSGRYLH